MQSTKRQKKVAISESIGQKVARSKSITITDYRGLTTAQLLELRQKLAQANAEFQVTKNTLLRRALQGQGYEVSDEVVEGPSATLFSYEDEVTPLKALTTFAKTTKLPSIKGGYLGKEFLNAQRVEALAKLPTKEVLIAQLMGTINAPVQGLVSVLQGNIRNLVYVLNAIRDSK